MKHTRTVWFCRKCLPTLIAAVLAWAWIILFVVGIVPAWAYWTVFGLYIAVAGWLYFVPDSWRQRRPSWRMSDSRTADGDERGRPSWSKEDHQRADDAEEF